jgi:hypothetical protein
MSRNPTRDDDTPEATYRRAAHQSIRAIRIAMERQGIRGHALRLVLLAEKNAKRYRGVPKPIPDLLGKLIKETVEDFEGRPVHG